MNKRLIIGIIVVLLVIVGGFIGVREFLSYRNVSIVLNDSDAALDIFTSNNRKVSSISSSSEIRLKTGSYYYIASSGDYSKDKQEFQVTDDTTVEFTPPYSSARLASLLTQDRPTIQSTLYTVYPSTRDEYIFADEQLSGRGEWYTTKLVQRVSGGNQPDIYRVVLKRQGDGWNVAISPRLVISKPDFSSVPKSIIDRVNAPLSTEGYALLYPE